MMKVSSKLDKSLKALEGIVNTLKKPQPLTYAEASNSGFALWWVTYPEAVKINRAVRTGTLYIPAYLSNTLSNLCTVTEQGFDLTIHPHPAYHNDGSIYRRDIIPESLPIDTEVFPDGIMIPYSMIAVVEGLAGVVTTMTGSEDLNFLHRMNDPAGYGAKPQFKDYLIWWLNGQEARDVINIMVTDCGSKIPPYLASSLGEIAHSFIGGFVNVPCMLTVAPHHVVADTLDDLDPQPPGQECMRDGILIPVDDMEKIHVAVGIFTNVMGDLRVKPHYPAVIDTRADNDQYCIWFLTDVQRRIIREGIDDGTVSLPGYLSKFVTDLASVTSTGNILVPKHITLDTSRIPPLSANEFGDMNGIVIHRADMNCVNRYCGEILSIELTSLPPTVNEFNLKPYTAEEIRAMFITHLNESVDYWVKQYPHDVRKVGEGVVFSTMTLLDGCTMDLPGFHVIPMGNHEDNEYVAAIGERPWPVPPTEAITQCIDIGGGLHDQLFLPQKPVVRSKSFITRLEYDAGILENRWAFVYEVYLRQTPFIVDRFATTHAGVVLSDAWRELAGICLKNGATYVQDGHLRPDEDYVFRWVTDDGYVLDNMVRDLSGYSLAGNF